MSPTIIATIITLGLIGIVAAMILFFVAQKFKVFEDPRIDQVDETLPGANCGGCGFPGCRSFAEACVKAETMEGLACPVGGNECMEAIAKILGREIAAQEPQVAVVRCNGTPANSKKINSYDGAATCAISSALYHGETGCPFSCLGLGDCVASCAFDAIHIDEKTGLPKVDDEKCVACGACVTACPRNVIELRKKAKKDRKIYVSCVNQDKGGIARKACAVACIGCKKCQKACPFDAITVENNIAYIDSNKCKLCRKCVAECPTGAILEFNFPPRKPKPPKTTQKTETKTVEKTNPQPKETSPKADNSKENIVQEKKIAQKLPDTEKNENK